MLNRWALGIIAGIILALFSLYPHWRISPRAEIERYVSADEIVDRVIRDLSPVGFSATN